jgi:hypothetical protein
MISRSMARPPGRPLALNETKQRLHARAELARVERLGEVIIGTRGEAFHLRLDRALRGEHEHGDARGERVGFHPTAHLEPVHAGHGVVENDEVGLAGLDSGEGGVTVFDEVDFVSRGPEQVPEHQAHLFVVVGEEQITHGSTGGCAWKVKADS